MKLRRLLLAVLYSLFTILLFARAAAAQNNLSPTPAPLPPPDYPPPGTLCNQYQFTNEPHPLRPAPALVCEDQVPQPFNLSCANDVVPKFTVNRPRTITNPGDSLEANTSCTKSGCRWDCTRQETLTEAAIGPVNITIDLTGLELPIAGIASRNCDTGYCDVDQINSTDGEKNLSDGFLMRNYTSWYLQGAIEQADQIPPDIQPKFLERALAYAGPLKKLIPQEILNGQPAQNIVGQREQLIGEAVAGRTYNQIIGYVNGNQVISRPEAKQTGLTGPGYAIRLTDMKDHINPPYNPDDPEAIKWYTLWRQVPFSSSGHIDTAGEFFPTACLRSTEDNRRCQTDPYVLDAKLKITSGLDSFRVYFPHLVEDDTLLAKLLQNALVSPDIPHAESLPNYTELSQNLTNPDRLPEWTVSDDGAYKNASGCRIENALYNPGDSLEAKRNRKQGLITAQLQFKRQVSYSYQVSDICDLNPIPGVVPVPVSAPVPVHIRYSHMDEIGDRTVVGPGSIFKSLYPDIPTTIGREIPHRPAEASLNYSCTSAGGGCQADSTSHKGSPRAFFPWWGNTLELFHQKLQCMLDPLQQGCGRSAIPTPTPVPAAVCQTYQPYSQPLSGIIDQAIAKGQAAAKVPKKVLEAIYSIEGFTAFTSPADYTCGKNPASALGLMQITDDAYRLTVPPLQRPPNDEHLCSSPPDILSRCNPVDAMEIAARVLLIKVGKWDFSTFQPTGTIAAKQEVYDASCRYYGSYRPDQHTNDRGDDDWSPTSPPVPDAPDGQTSYCEVVCARSGYCPPYPLRP